MAPPAQADPQPKLAKPGSTPGSSTTFSGASRLTPSGSADVLRVFAGIWTTETEKRVQGRLENVLDFAAARRWREATNPARWRGHLGKLLPRTLQPFVG